MPRPMKCRRICEMPSITKFAPQETEAADVTISMTLDEYETIRLIDGQGLMQEEAAERMNIARTTVQAIYNSARKKLADFLTNGKRLCIEGGNIEVCEGGCCSNKKNCPQCHCNL